MIPVPNQLKLFVFMRWEFNLFPTVLWDIGHVGVMQGNSTTVEHLFMLLSGFSKFWEALFIFPGVYVQVLHTTSKNLFTLIFNKEVLG